MVDYRAFRFRNLRSPAFSHLLLLLFWPVYGLMFLLLERVLPLSFQEISCALDDLIPFCEWFILPYYAWFAFLVVPILYLGLFDVPNFRRYMWFIILTYSSTVLIYLLWPTCQNLRPDTFPRQNLLTEVVAFLYRFDTNTNVCPSIHVLGMSAAFAAMWHTERMQTVGWRIFWIVSFLLVNLSTVFLKQHSILDVLAAGALSLVAYVIVYKTSFVEAVRRRVVKPTDTST